MTMRQGKTVTVTRHHRFARVLQVQNDAAQWQGIFYIAPGVGHLGVQLHGFDYEFMDPGWRLRFAHHDGRLDGPIDLDDELADGGD